MPTGLPQYSLNNPTGLGIATVGTGLLTGAGQGAVGQPPQTGTGGATSPTGVASPATSDSSGLDAGLGLLLGTGLGMYETNQAGKANTAAVGAVTGPAGQLQNTGQTLLSQATSGQLTPAQSTVVGTLESQGQQIIKAATPMGEIAQQLMQQYQSGQLKPADQAQLDQQTTAAKAQLAQMLGSNVDSTTMAMYSSQIDQQALITKQNILNSYLATGNAEFDQWLQTTEAGNQAVVAGQEFAVSQIDNTFEKALGAMSIGGTQMLAGISLGMQQNQQLATAFQNYMANLTKGYAQSVASGATSLGQAIGGATSGGGGGGTAGAGTGNPAVAPTGSMAPAPYNITSDPSFTSDPGISDLLSSTPSYSNYAGGSNSITGSYYG
jgi:hypothetical protein